MANKLANGGRLGTVSAAYCYGVWLRHLTLAHRSGLNSDPTVIAELGPGASLGIGLCGVLTGADKYFALDLISYAEADRNLEIFGQLTKLLEARTPIPGPNQFPSLSPRLNDYSFPSDVLTEQRLARCLAPARVAAIRRAITRMAAPSTGDVEIVYIAPWDDPEKCREASVDMVFSQAVLEHVDDLPATHSALNRWLKDDGFVSHRIDYKSHGTAQAWNGHWQYSDRKWRVIRGRRPYLLNRLPHSAHLRLLHDAHLRVVYTDRSESLGGVGRVGLAPSHVSASDQDLRTSGAFLQAVRTVRAAPVQ